VEVRHEAGAQLAVVAQRSEVQSSASMGILHCGNNLGDRRSAIQRLRSAHQGGFISVRSSAEQAVDIPPLR
jgi:hypothetical protein